MQIVEHLHLQGVVAHGEVAVLGHDEVDADKAGLVGVHACLNGLKAEQRLRKDLLRRIAAQNLVDVADFHLAGGRGLWGAAVLDLAALGFGGAHFFAVGGHFVAQAEGEKFLAEAGQTPR